MIPKLTVGVVFGGRSGEHEVSLSSAQSILRAIDANKYNIVPIGIDRDGHWMFDEDPMETLVDGGSARPGAPLWPSPEQLAGLDVVFPILHGTYGEDGTVQGLLDLTGIPYVGCGVLPSALAMDKAVARTLFATEGLPLSPWTITTRARFETAPDLVVAELEAALSYPMFTKPANLGSSVGISKVCDRAALLAGLGAAAAYDRRIVVEQAVPHAREIEVSVLGNDDPVASMPGEIVPSNEFYDYASKYLDGASRELIPAPVSPEKSEVFRTLAVRAFRAIDGNGYARVDFLMNGETGEIFISEVNTIPGFTNISMFPKLWQASGLPYTQLIDRLIEFALERHAERLRNRTTR